MKIRNKYFSNKNIKAAFVAVLMFSNFQSVALAQDPWKIMAEHIDSTHYYGVTVANGMLGLVSSPQPLKTSCVVLGGSYDKFGRGDVSNFLRGFNILNTELDIDGNKISCSNIHNYTQELDMKDAIFMGKFDFGTKASVAYSFFSLRQLPYCALLTVDIVPHTDIVLHAANVQDLPEGFKNGENTYSDIAIGHAKVRLLSTESESPTGKLKMCASSSFLFPTDISVPQVHYTRIKDGGKVEFDCTLKKDMHYRFAIVGSTMSSAVSSDPINEVKRLVVYCQMEGIDKLVDRHKACWADLWKSDIQIKGDPQSQQDVHSMMYHLYSFVRAGSALSVSPMGLSGLGYNGHVFWDADLWMYPALLLLHPELAKSMIEYRYDRLKAAKDYAFEHGYQGAQYPWESSDSGGEDTPVWAMSGPFEHSITGCVGLAAWQYYCVTKDRNWLEKKGYPILKETADFWLSRVEPDASGACHIRNVVASDEWAENVDDDAFTNGVAKVNLLCAARAAKLLKEPVNLQWEQTAAKIPFYHFSDGVTKEFLTYKGENIKQADVNLLPYPLKLITEVSQIRKDLAYYQVRVPAQGTPAMTQAIFSLLYSRLGDAGNAWKYFQDAYLPNLLPPFRVIAETKGGTNPYFATGAGGVLQAVLMGFGGLDIDYVHGGIRQVRSVLPENWKSLTFTAVGANHSAFSRENH